MQRLINKSVRNHFEPRLHWSIGLYLDIAGVQTAKEWMRRRMNCFAYIFICDIFIFLFSKFRQRCERPKYFTDFKNSLIVAKLTLSVQNSLNVIFSFFFEISTISAQLLRRFQRLFHRWKTDILTFQSVPVSSLYGA